MVNANEVFGDTEEEARVAHEGIQSTEDEKAAYQQEYEDEVNYQEPIVLGETAEPLSRSKLKEYREEQEYRYEQEQREEAERNEPITISPGKSPSRSQIKEYREELDYQIDPTSYDRPASTGTIALDMFEINDEKRDAKDASDFLRNTGNTREYYETNNSRALNPFAGMGSIFSANPGTNKKQSGNLYAGLPAGGTFAMMDSIMGKPSKTSKAKPFVFSGLPAGANTNLLKPFKSGGKSGGRGVNKTTPVVSANPIAFINAGKPVKVLKGGRGKSGAIPKNILDANLNGGSPLPPKRKQYAADYLNTWKNEIYFKKTRENRAKFAELEQNALNASAFMGIPGASLNRYTVPVDPESSVSVKPFKNNVKMSNTVDFRDTPGLDKFASWVQGSGGMYNSKKKKVAEAEKNPPPTQILNRGKNASDELKREAGIPLDKFINIGSAEKIIRGKNVANKEKIKDINEKLREFGAKRIAVKKSINASYLDELDYYNTQQDTKENIQSYYKWMRSDELKQVNAEANKKLSEKQKIRQHEDTITRNSIDDFVRGQESELDRNKKQFAHDKEQSWIFGIGKLHDELTDKEKKDAAFKDVMAGVEMDIHAKEVQRIETKRKNASPFDMFMAWGRGDKELAGLATKNAKAAAANKLKQWNADLQQGIKDRKAANDAKRSWFYGGGLSPTAPTKENPYGHFPTTKGVPRRNPSPFRNSELVSIVGNHRSGSMFGMRKPLKGKWSKRKGKVVITKAERTRARKARAKLPRSFLDDVFGGF